MFGSVFCAVIIYAMGYYGGKGFAKKYGKYFFMKEEDLDKTDTWFEKYGLIAACIGRNVPIIRTLISLPIGITRLSFKRFLIYTLIGSVPWTFVFVYFGFALGNNWTILTDFTSKLKTPIRILIVILLISFLYTKIKKIIKKKKSQSR